MLGLVVDAWIVGKKKMLTRVNCQQCGKSIQKEVQHVNRAKRRGNKLFCDRVCFGLSRRKNQSKGELVEKKRLYDIEYRNKNRDILKAKKSEYFQRTYDPQKARIERKKNMQRHIEYCRRPEYVEWKKEYDKQYRAKKDFGEFWESKLALQEIDEILKPHRYEIMIENGTFCKAQRRKRECQTAN